MVLCLGVLIHFVSAVSALLDDSLRETPAWVGSVMGIATSVQVAAAMAWIMYRSDKPLNEFGIRPVKLGRDMGFAVCVCAWSWLAFLLAQWLLMLTWSIPGVAEACNIIPPSGMPSWDLAPRGTADLALFVGYDIANGFAEELVIRCYLITRLTQLLGGPWRAVVTAAAIMASYHVYQGSYAAIAIFLAQIGIGGLWLVIPRLWPFAIGHALYNMLLMATYGT